MGGWCMSSVNMGWSTMPTRVTECCAVGWLRPLIAWCAILPGIWSTWRTSPTLPCVRWPIQKKAKEAGFPAANCLYCHNEKLPVKGKTVTHNERGTFLVHQKEVKKAKEVDVAWLKDFVEAKK